MNILLVEDEEMAAKKLTRTLATVEPQAVIVGITGSIRDTIDWLSRCGGLPDSPDLILMDIELADGQSFQIFKQISVTVPVIFTTSYDEYAIRAFRVNSLDYLLKPVQKDELRAALDKFISQQQARQPTQVDTSETVRQLLRTWPQPHPPKNYLTSF